MVYCVVIVIVIIHKNTSRRTSHYTYTYNRPDWHYTDFLAVFNSFCSFLANVNSSSCSLFVIDGPSVVCRLSSVCLSVCLSSVTRGLSSHPSGGEYSPPEKFYSPPNKTLLTPPQGWCTIRYARSLKDWELLHNWLSADLVTVYYRRITD